MDTRRPLMIVLALAACLRTAACGAADAAGTPPDPGASAIPEAAGTSGASPDRRFTMSIEAGWNGLAGFGPVFAWRCLPRFTAELGAGLSAAGVKAGTRFRWNPVPGNWSPVLGVAALYAGGLPGEGMQMDETVDGRTTSYAFRLGASTWVQGVLGVEYRAAGGFTWLLTLGRVELLNHNVTVTSGDPTGIMKTAMRILYGSGPVIATSFGWSF